MHPPRVILTGRWTLSNFNQAKALLRAECRHFNQPARSTVEADTAHKLNGDTNEQSGAANQVGKLVHIDGLGIERLDSSAAHLLHKFFGAEVLERGDFSTNHAKLIGLIVKACNSSAPAREQPANSVIEILESVGAAAHRAWIQQKLLLGFTGQALLQMITLARRPSRWRVTAFVAQIEQIGLNAVPIVALLTFLVGAVVAFLGATVLAEFGAEIYTVNLVGFSFLREFGVLLAAILLAGRTASAFTAQLGSMKANEEIDALRAQGLNPIEILVVPRLLAMVISLPALTLIAMLSGVAGGMLVSWLALDISPQLFIHVFQRDIAIDHFWVGLIKAPIFAIVIALIGCLEGFKVAGSAQSVGEHTTSSVVQSIFMVILLDALFALFFMEIDW